MLAVVTHTTGSMLVDTALGCFTDVVSQMVTHAFSVAAVIIVLLEASALVVIPIAGVMTLLPFGQSPTLEPPAILLETVLFLASSMPGIMPFIVPSLTLECALVVVGSSPML